MAESDHHSYRDPAAACNAPTPPRDQADDPLVALARLIDQSLPMNDLARDARCPTAAGTAREFNPPAQHGHAAPEDVRHPPNGTHDEGQYESLPRADACPQSRSVWYGHETDAADPNLEASGVRCDEYEQQSHNHSDDHAYGEDYDEDPNLRRRGILVAAVFGLAMLGAAGAFAYRAPFADSIVPSLLSIIKAESGPNKIMPTSTASQGSVSPQADASDNAGSSQRRRLVPQEERPVDAPASVSVAAPIIPDPAPAAGPGTASEFALTPLEQSPAARVDSLDSQPTAPAPPIPSANQAATPAASSPTQASDQPNAADSESSQSQSVAVGTTAQGAKPSGANESRSIVPSSNDAERAAAGSARIAPPARPAPVGKPAATKIASTSPAASGGGYAVQVSSQRNESEVQSSFRALQAKYPKLLRGREPMVRRADLGAKGIYYRTMVGPFVSADQANELCANLKAAGGNCIVQKN